MTDKREQLIALCQLLGLSKTIKDDPAELIDAVLCENARINAECVARKQALTRISVVAASSESNSEKVRIIADIVAVVEGDKRD